VPLSKAKDEVQIKLQKKVFNVEQKKGMKQQSMHIWNTNLKFENLEVDIRKTFLRKT